MSNRQPMSRYQLRLIGLLIGAIHCQALLSCTKLRVGLSKPSISSDAPPGAQEKFAITGLSKVVVAPGEILTIEGSNFTTDLKIAIQSLANATSPALAGVLNVKSSTSAILQVPSEAPYGPLALNASQGETTQKVTVFSTGGKTDQPISALTPDQVCSGIKFYSRTGTLTTGTKSCSATPSCTGTSAATAVTATAAASCPTAPTIPSCSAEGIVGCLTTTAFKAADMSQAVASNIAAGATVLGVVGSAGPSCTTDGQQNCTVTGVLKAANVSGMTAWDLRAGKSLAGIGGTLSANCRNSINSTYYNWDGAIGSLPNTAQTSGSSNDWWDTVDDYYGLSSTQVTGWSSDTSCNSSAWTDVTTANGGSTTTTCALSAANCQYRDNITNMVVSKNISLSASWSTAIKACNSSTYGGYAAGTWRVPTQKELMAIYEHGLVSLASTNFMTLATLTTYSFWTSTNYALDTNNGWFAKLSNGYFDGGVQTANYAVLCVR